MEDGYLEKHYEEYERRKAEWLKKKKFKPAPKPAPKAGEDQ